MKPIKTIFLGTTVEGIPSLKELHSHRDFTVQAVVTQPDRPVGRKQVMQPTPIKKSAVELNLPVLEATKTESVYDTIISQFKPDLAVVIGFGEFLPESFLQSLRLSCINVHYSLLPLLRGAVPAQMAILNGFTETGITIQIMEPTMDTGPVLAQVPVPIDDRETTPSLKDKLIPAGTKLLMETLPKWGYSSLQPSPQDDSKATYCYMKDISKENAEIQWDTHSPEYIDRMVRAFLPWPVAWTTLPDAKRLKISEARLVSIKETCPAGTILPRKDGLFFCTKQPKTALHAILVQAEGRPVTQGSAFIQGLRLS